MSTTLEQKRTERDMRDARDRVLAREVGIEIGRRRERDRQHRERERAWGRGFFVGITVAAVVMLVTLYAAEKVEAAEVGPNSVSANHDIGGKSANGDTVRKVRIGSGAASSWAVYRLGERTMPPGWRTFLRICQLEQPGDGWRGVWWTNTVNYSFPGGCGLRQGNFDEVKHPAWPDTADQLSPRDQLWASFWLFWTYARIGQDIRGSYEGGQRYGSTVWDVHDQPGLMFDGFHADGKTPV